MSGARVLVVEDEALTAIAMAQAVEAAGYQVLGPVGRVQDAIDMAQTTRPDAAVLDVDLPWTALVPDCQDTELNGRAVSLLHGIQFIE